MNTHDPQINGYYCSFPSGACTSLPKMSMKELWERAAEAGEGFYYITSM